MTALAPQQDGAEAEDVRCEVAAAAGDQPYEFAETRRFRAVVGPHEHLFISATADNDAEGTRGAHCRNPCRIYAKTRDCPHRRLELGAVPVVSTVAAVSYLKNFPVDAFFVRKAQKEHGARER
jgi:hypothetical protein